jgi:dTDP-4-dehydrorhamnose 3,5-epimerase
MKFTTGHSRCLADRAQGVWGCARLFLESFRQDLFNQATGTNYEFIQDNHSRSSKGVLRGLHYQLPPHAQGKLVRVISGAVFDVAVDIRRSSPTFGQWVGRS